MWTKTERDRNNRVGFLRQDNIARVLREWGYRVRTAVEGETSKDIFALRGHNFVFIEVLNWNRDGRLGKVRSRSIINNLIDISENRFLVCSFQENVKSRLEDFMENEIEIIYIGFQTIPEEIFDKDYDEAKIERTGARRNGKEVIEALREKLIPFRDLPLRDSGKYSTRKLKKKFKEKFKLN